MHSIGYWDIHEPGHELNGFKLSDALDQELNCLLWLVSEEDVGVFIDHIHYSGVLHVLEILQCLLVGLLREVVHHDHLEVVLPISKANQVPDSSVGLHDQIDKLLID